MYEPNIVLDGDGYDQVAGNWATFKWDWNNESTEQEVDWNEGGWYQVEFRPEGDTDPAHTYVAPAPLMGTGGDGGYPYLNVHGMVEDQTYELRVREVYEPGPTSNFSEWSDWFPYTPNNA